MVFDFAYSAHLRQAKKENIITYFVRVSQIKAKYAPLVLHTSCDRRDWCRVAILKRVRERRVLDVRN